MKQVLFAIHDERDDFFAKYYIHPYLHGHAIIATKATILCDEHEKQTTASRAIESIEHDSAYIPILLHQMASPFQIYLKKNRHNLTTVIRTLR
jgi:hypothetical protein